MIHNEVIINYTCLRESYFINAKQLPFYQN